MGIYLFPHLYQLSFLLMSPNRLICFLVLSLSLATTNNVNAKTLRVAVASNFVETAQQLSLIFTKQTGQSIQISSGSSGKLFLQISNGAPFDLFLSADSHKPSELVKNGLALANSQQTYAIGKLVLWLRDCSNTGSLFSLASQRVRKIAIANPKLAPYGYASQKLLENHNLWNKLSDKLIYPENIAQVSQFAKLGVIEGALVAGSNVNRLETEGKSCLTKLKMASYPAITQQLVIVSKSENKELAIEFIRFLSSDKAKNLINNMGYLLPNSGKIVPLQ